ncbi:MAG: RnfABCDGE type electron transport complex subunit B [Gammaproteobacteria bacterium]|nr:RnfABCDGE type electron transport complex subunit B [Gammaproteobacteria bacterium]
MPSVSDRELADRIGTVLPQTQCGHCGFDSCAPFAEAVAKRTAHPEQCTPGGALVARRLREILGDTLQIPAQAELMAPIPHPAIARISEAACIGCTKCLEVCPVDAIVGAAHQMHTVLEQHCTGCGLCLPPCPVDCIELSPRTELAGSWPARNSAVAQVITATPAQPCTRCEACVPVCPESLRPDRLLHAALALEVDTVAELRLEACTECNACQEVCPSHIPLTAYFIHTKQIVAAAESVTRTASAAARRYTSHRERQHRGTEDRQHANLLMSLESLSSVAAKAEIAAALARARER